MLCFPEVEGLVLSLGETDIFHCKTWAVGNVITRLLVKYVSGISAMVATTGATCISHLVEQDLSALRLTRPRTYETELARSGVLNGK